MVPVAANHAAHIIHGNVLPWLVADVLPAGDLFKHQQTDLVAGVEEVARLRVMGSADDVAVEILAQNDGVTPLHPAGHGLTHPWKGLMAVQAAQLDDGSIE